MKTPSDKVTPIVKDGEADDASVFNYFALSNADRIKTVHDRIQELEKTYMDLEMAQICLEGNPEPGDHTERKLPDGTDVPCQCTKCELKRVNRLQKSNGYAIQQLKALYGRLQ